MKLRYNRDEDIMLPEISDEAVDFAEEMGPVIIHFSKNGKPVILEILEASEFIATAAKSTIQAKGFDPIEVQL